MKTLFSKWNEKQQKREAPKKLGILNLIVNYIKNK